MSNTTIQLRHSTETGNVPVSLANGEIAVNSQDGKLFYADPTGTVQEFSLYPGPSGLDTEIQFNDSGVLGSSANLSFNKTTNVLSTKNIIVSGNSYFGNANLHEGITQLSVTNAGAGAYLFDQYPGNNPSLYVGAGQTISFNLNVVGHPFLIRESSGGANISDGLTHISNTGVVTTGDDAQGKVSGVLFWKVPFSLVGSTYVYQCQIHGGMVGDIVIQQPASFVAANTTLAFNTANAAFLAANAATATDTTQNNSIAAAFIHANAAFNAANTGGGSSEDQYARNTANAAFDNSNTKFNSSGGTISGDVFITGGLFPSVDNTGVVGNSAFTWDNGQFTDLTIDNILNVRTAIDLADGDILRFGTNDDWEMFHDGTANRIDLNVGDLTIRDDGTEGDPTRFTFGRTTGNFTANGNVSATNFLVGSLNINEHTQSAFDTANSASVYANGAFVRANNSLNANTGGEVSANVTISANLTASNVATQTYIQFGDGTKQFTASTDTDQYSRNTANAAFVHANASFDFANTISGGSAIDNVARALANSAASTNITQNNSIAAAFIHANSAFDAANTGGGITVTVDTIPLASGNTIGDIWIDTDTGKEFRWIDDGDSYQWVEFGGAGISGADGSQAFADLAFNHANSSFDQANAAFDTSNTNTTTISFAYDHANAAFEYANTIIIEDTYARNHSNASFDVANTKVTTGKSIAMAIVFG